MKSKQPKALAYAFFGARGTGKNQGLNVMLANERPSRLMVWDYKNDPALVHIGKPLKALAALVQETTAATFVVRYIVDHDKDIHAQFDLFCKVAWERGNLMMVVDELPEVTKANKAPPSWRKCVNVGREYLLKGKPKWLAIVGLGQRPSECDKSFISNCDVYHVGRLTFKADAVSMADPMGCDFKALMHLPDLQFYEKSVKNTEYFHGQLHFSNGKVSVKTIPKA
jgi:hypothetical protein